jgi:hypothetical protein
MHKSGRRGAERVEGPGKRGRNEFWGNERKAVLSRVATKPFEKDSFVAWLTTQKRQPFEAQGKLADALQMGELA